MASDALQHVRQKFPDVRSSWSFGETAGIGTVSSALLTDAALAHVLTLPPHNMRTRARQDAEHAGQSRERLCRALAVDSRRLCFMEQVHGSNIAPAAQADSGGCLAGVDGMVVNRHDVIAMALSADCPVVIAYDQHQQVLGVAHAGWRGTVGQITRKLVTAMIEEYRCSAESLLAAISPSAGPCCYEVGGDVIKAASSLSRHEELFVDVREAVHFDLWSANVAQLTEAGVPVSQIDLAGECTVCDERFFSYRRDGRSTGHAALLATLLFPDTY